MMDKLHGFESELELERWQHAACLSIAEGAPGMPPEHLQSPAMKAVKKLRDELATYRGYSAFLSTCAKSGEQPETYAWYLEKSKQ